MAYYLQIPDAQPARALDAHRFLIRLSSATVGAFLWIFVFQYYAYFEMTICAALFETLLLYALCQCITLLLTPFAAGRMRNGMRRGVVFGTLTLAASFIFGASMLNGAFPHGAAVFAILFGAYRALYRVPYAVERGGSGLYGRTSLLLEIALALMPTLAGVYLALGNNAEPYTAASVLFIAGICALTALLPLPWVPDVHERFSWSYRESFSQLLELTHRVLFTQAVAAGMGGTFLFLLLPLSAFFLFSGSYFIVGTFFSMALFVILISRNALTRVMVEQHADLGHYLDEFTVLKEMGLACGRLALVLALAISLVFFI